MSVATALPEPPRRPARWRQPPARLAIALAWALAKLPPRRIRSLMETTRKGARPATYAEAEAARNQIVALSVACAGEGCLQRSLATALLCRMHGTWPTWRTGVRTQPFTAHAWVEADNRPVAEPETTAHYRPVITVTPAQRQPHHRQPPR
ncbi:lasso peptide biosynthesis B2 protein [Streptomyces sp. NPDC003077]|uniref:lasso peptide biosynthesis B2 protein n=1 Tax=Streptomyces sp. NPDC003077 TaxID=3154443 RepID=UPI0033B06216